MTTESHQDDNKRVFECFYQSSPSISDSYLSLAFSKQAEAPNLSTKSKQNEPAGPGEVDYRTDFHYNSNLKANALFFGPNELKSNLYAVEYLQDLDLFREAISDHSLLAIFRKTLI